MNRYRGIIEIDCNAKTCRQKTADGNVRPACCDCPDATVAIVGLDGKVLATLKPRSKWEKPAPKKTSGKKKITT